MAAKVIFVGLDSAEPELIRKWTAEGLLPNIQRLQTRGATGPLRIPPGMGNGAAWPSLYTGVNPGRHGRYFRSQFDPVSYQQITFDDDHRLRHDPFWVKLSDAGRKVAVIDVVHAPVCKVNGIYIADWMTHGASLPPRSCPPELIREVTERFGADPLYGRTDVIGRRSAKSYVQFRDQMLARVRAKTALTRHLLEREDWDFFMVSYGEPHDLGHQCWHLHDSRHAEYDAEWVRQYGDPIRDLYVELDRALGEICDSAGQDSIKIVFAGPGMEPNYTGNHLMATIIDRLENAYEGRGIDATQETIDRVKKTYALQMRNAVFNIRRIYRRWIPEAIRSHLRLGRAHPVASTASEPAKGPRPKLSTRKFFRVLHNQNAGAVRFNVVGRDRYGIVPPGKEFDALRQRVIRDLLDLVNVESGDRAIAQIIDVAEHYHGEHLADLPDLLLVWSRTAPIRGLHSPLIGTVKGIDASSRTGDHNPNTLLIMTGPDIAPGQFPGNARVEDFAPTVTSLLGVELTDIDGSPLVAKPSSVQRASL